VSEPRIVISGTGRAGTTVLVQILDELGLDTGLRSGKLTPFEEQARAGLEFRVDYPDAPPVVKDVTFAFRARDVLALDHVHIDHVIIPTRRLDVAAASRVRAAEYGKVPFKRGALAGTMRATDQARALAEVNADFIAALREHHIAYTTIEFPRFTKDPKYFHDTLSFLFPDRSVADVRRALKAVVRPELIHQRPLSRRERWLTRLYTLWSVTIGVPWAKYRAWRDPAKADERLRESMIASGQLQPEAAKERWRDVIIATGELEADPTKEEWREVIIASGELEADPTKEEWREVIIASGELEADPTKEEWHEAIEAAVKSDADANFRRHLAESGRLTIDPNSEAWREAIAKALEQGKSAGSNGA
jgi:hypothetical protein